MVVSHPAVLPVNQLVYAELAKRGWSVHVVVPHSWEGDYGDRLIVPTPLETLKGSYSPTRVLLPGKVQRHFYLTDPFKWFRRLSPQFLFLEQEAFSISALQWGLAARAARVPFAIQMDENLDRRLPIAARAIRSQVLPHVQFVAARSHAAAALATSWGARGDVPLIPHHIPGWEVPDRQSHATFVVGFAGRLVPQKGLATLVDAVRMLKDPVELLVVGDGPRRRWLESQDLGGSRLRVLRGTSHDDMASAYVQMDALVLPSITTPTWAEQFGRVLVEAMWCGTPVIVSSSGEIPWVIRTSGGGEVFAEGDAADLARIIERYRSESALRLRYAENGRRGAGTLYSVPSVATALATAIRGGSGD